MPPKDVERMANSVDPDQTADQNLHFLLRHTCPNILNFYGYVIFYVSLSQIEKFSISNFPIIYVVKPFIDKTDESCVT